MSVSENTMEMEILDAWISVEFSIEM